MDWHALQRAVFGHKPDLNSIRFVPEVVYAIAVPWLAPTSTAFYRELIIPTNYVQVLTSMIFIVIPDIESRFDCGIDTAVYQNA